MPDQTPTNDGRGTPITAIDGFPRPTPAEQRLMIEFSLGHPTTGSAARTARRNAGLSLHDLGEMIGVSGSLLGNIELGRMPLHGPRGAAVMRAYQELGLALSAPAAVVPITPDVVHAPPVQQHDDLDGSGSDLAHVLDTVRAELARLSDALDAVNADNVRKAGVQTRVGRMLDIIDAALPGDLDAE